MNDPVLARLAALKTTSTSKLREQWRKRPANDRPVSGTRLIREYQGVEHCITVRDKDFEYQGRPYKSLSAIARAITGTQWNGLTFFGLKSGAGKQA